MTAYDEVPYPSAVYRRIHPAVLASQQALFGLPFAPPSNAAVLELGCGDGSNLIPMAVAAPDARFVGIDYAPQPVGRGQAVIERLGLSNIRLEVRDVCDGPGRLGQFDYILAHGLYAWIPPAVADAAMALTGACLSHDGLAMISYNALPGCALRVVLREILLREVAGAASIGERIDRARGVLADLIRGFDAQQPLPAALKDECERMLARDPNVLFHDELGPEYHPAFVGDVAAHASRHGLHYFGDAAPAWLADEAPDAARDEQERVDPVRRAQHGDYLAPWAFRHTLLTRRPAEADRRLDLARISGLWGALAHRLAADAGNSLTVAGPDGARAEIGDPRLMPLLRTLHEAWPQAARLDAATPAVAGAILQLWAGGFIELRVEPLPLATGAGARPQVCPLVRLQAEAGQTRLTSRRHRVVEIGDTTTLKVLTLLDGTRDQEALAIDVAAMTGIPAAAVAAGLPTNLADVASLGLLSPT